MPNSFPVVKTRSARPEDIANIADLLSRTFYAQQGWRSLMTPIFKLGLCYDLAMRLQAPTLDNYRCLVAEVPHPQDARTPILVGTVEVGLRSLSLSSLTTPTKAYISNLAVQMDYRQNGIGAQLLAECEAIAKSWNRTDIFLHVRSDNAIAHGLYRKLGYQSNQTSHLQVSRQLLHKRLA